MRGIDWQGWAAIIGAFAALMVAVITWVEHRQKQLRQQQEALNQTMTTQITTAVNHLSEVLLAKLETKETVSRISERLARLEGASSVSNNMEVK